MYIKKWKEDKRGKIFWNKKQKEDEKERKICKVEQKKRKLYAFLLAWNKRKERKRTRERAGACARDNAFPQFLISNQSVAARARARVLASPSPHHAAYSAPTRGNCSKISTYVNHTHMRTRARARVCTRHVGTHWRRCCTRVCVGETRRGGGAGHAWPVCHFHWLVFGSSHPPRLPLFCRSSGGVVGKDPLRALAAPHHDRSSPRVRSSRVFSS